MDNNTQNDGTLEACKVLKETDHYYLVIGNSTGAISVPCYQIINKEYGVTEQEFFVLAQAYVNMDNMEQLLREYLNPKGIIKPEKAKSNVVKLEGVTND